MLRRPYSTTITQLCLKERFQILRLAKIIGELRLHLAKYVEHKNKRESTKISLAQQHLN